MPCRAVVFHSCGSSSSSHCSVVGRSSASFLNMQRSTMRFMTMVTVQERSPHFSKNNLKGGLRDIATSRKRVAYWLAFAERLGLCGYRASFPPGCSLYSSNQLSKLNAWTCEKTACRREWNGTGLNRLPVLHPFNFRFFFLKRAPCNGCSTTVQWTRNRNFLLTPTVHVHVRVEWSQHSNQCTCMACVL